MIRYNISRPVHDPRAAPPRPPLPKIWGVATPTPRIYISPHKFIAISLTMSVFVIIQSSVSFKRQMIPPPYTQQCVCQKVNDPSSNYFHLYQPPVDERLLQIYYMYDIVSHRGAIDIP